MLPFQASSPPSVIKYVISVHVFTALTLLFTPTSGHIKRKRLDVELLLRVRSGAGVSLGDDEVLLGDVETLV